VTQEQAVDDRLTPEEELARARRELAEGPQPLKPIPPELLAEILAEDDSPEESERGYRELMENGGYSGEEVLTYLQQLVEKYR
jgi:hypothetical protein